MRDPRAVRFIDWWERNADRYPDALWFDAFDYWTEPRALDGGESLALWHEAAEEYHTRQYLRRRARTTEPLREAA
jgi:hypothetical protein